MTKPTKERSKRERELRNTPATELQRSKKFSLTEVSAELARRFVTPRSHR